MHQRYGWIPQLPDHRDRLCTAASVSPLPSRVDLRPQCPPVYDQGQLGACTGNAIAAALEFDRMKQGLVNFVPSRLFIYYNERAMEGTIASDSGAQIRDGIKSVATQGDCPETEWPYDPSQFATQPPDTCYVDAAKYTAVSYEAVGQDLLSTRACLAIGRPFVFGFTVYSSFESAAVAQNGVVPMPGWFDRSVGGHAVMAVGYDDSQNVFIVRNSWGAVWGDGGYFYLPYRYLTNSNLASDLWTIELTQ